MGNNYIKKYEPLFGKWYVENKIGEGANGKVYTIFAKADNKTIESALKFMTIPGDDSVKKQLLDDGMTKEQLQKYSWSQAEKVLNEIILMSNLLGNANVVKYEEHQIIEHEDKLGYDILIRLEKLTPLSKYLYENKLSVKNVINIGIDICTALNACYEHKIVHRDVKIENIFVDSFGIFKLGDFGNSCILDASIDPFKSKAGTITYVAPEIFKGISFDYSVDTYSLGIVLYKLLNYNRPPFYPHHPQEIVYTDKENAIQKRLNGDVFPFPQIHIEKLSNVILKACAYNREDRFKTPEDMKSALSDFQKNPELDQVIVNNFSFSNQKNTEELLPKNEEFIMNGNITFFDSENTVILPLSINDSENSKNTANNHAQRSIKLSEKIFSKMIQWILYTCVLSLLPLIISNFLSLCFSLNAQEGFLVGELFFFAITISIVTVKDMIGFNLRSKEVNIFNIALFCCIFILILSSVLYGIVILKNIAPQLAIDVSNDTLKFYSIIMTILSFVFGTIIQIWEVI